MSKLVDKKIKDLDRWMRYHDEWLLSKFWEKKFWNSRFWRNHIYWRYIPSRYHKFFIWLKI